MGATVNTTAPYTLVVNKNLTANISIIIRAEYDYTDAVSGAQTTVIQEITITRQENAGPQFWRKLTAHKILL